MIGSSLSDTHPKDVALGKPTGHCHLYIIHPMQDMKDTRSLPEWTVWSKPLEADGSRVAALIINTRQDTPATASTTLAALGLRASRAGAPVAVTEVWTGSASVLHGAEWTAAVPAGGHLWVILEVQK